MLTIELLKSAYLTQKSLSGTCLLSAELASLQVGEVMLPHHLPWAIKTIPSRPRLFSPPQDFIFPTTVSWRLAMHVQAQRRLEGSYRSIQPTNFKVLKNILNYRQAYGVGKIFSKNSPCRGCLYWLSASLVMLTGPVSVGNGLFIQG